MEKEFDPNDYETYEELKEKSPEHADEFKETEDKKGFVKKTVVDDVDVAHERAIRMNARAEGVSEYLDIPDQYDTLESYAKSVQEVSAGKLDKYTSHPGDLVHKVAFYTPIPNSSETEEYQNWLSLLKDRIPIKYRPVKQDREHAFCVYLTTKSWNPGIFGREDGQLGHYNIHSIRPNRSTALDDKKWVKGLVAPGFSVVFSEAMKDKISSHDLSDEEVNNFVDLYLKNHPGNLPENYPDLDKVEKQIEEELDKDPEMLKNKLRGENYWQQHRYDRSKNYYTITPDEDCWHKYNQAKRRKYEEIRAPYEEARKKYWKDYEGWKKYTEQITEQYDIRNTSGSPVHAIIGLIAFYRCLKQNDQEKINRAKRLMFSSFWDLDDFGIRLVRMRKDQNGYLAESCQIEREDIKALIFPTGKSEGGSFTLAEF